MSGKKTYSQLYYARKKQDPEWYERHKQRTRDRYAKDAKYRSYMKEKNKAYKSDSERSKEWRQKQRDKLTKAYIVELLRRAGYKPEEITPRNIRRKRIQVRAMRKLGVDKRYSPLKK